MNEGLIFGLSVLFFLVCWLIWELIPKKRFNGQMKNPPKPPPKQTTDYSKMSYADLMELFREIRNEILKRDKKTIRGTYKNKYP